MSDAPKQSFWKKELSFRRKPKPAPELRAEAPADDEAARIESLVKAAVAAAIQPSAAPSATPVRLEASPAISGSQGVVEALEPPPASDAVALPPVTFELPSDLPELPAMLREPSAAAEEVPTATQDLPPADQEIENLPPLTRELLPLPVDEEPPPVTDELAPPAISGSQGVVEPFEPPPAIDAVALPPVTFELPSDLPELPAMLRERSAAAEDVPTATQDLPPADQEMEDLPPSTQELLPLPVSEEPPPVTDELPPPPVSDELPPVSQELPPLPVAEETPPVPAELPPPPVSDELPPLSQELLPLPVDEEPPPVTDELPPPLISDQLPPLSQELPPQPVAEELPPVSDELPPVTQHVPPLSEALPPAVEEPPAAEELPPLSEELPPVTELPPAAQELPSAAEALPPVVHEEPLPVADSTAEESTRPAPEAPAAEPRKKRFARKPKLERPTEKKQKVKKQKPAKPKRKRRNVSLKVKLPTFKRTKRTKRGGQMPGRIVGLKIGASQIAAARVTNNGSAELVQVARGPLAHGIVVGGELRDPEKLTEALTEFFRKNDLPKSNVRLGIASNRIGVRTFDIEGVVDTKQLDNAVRFRAQETLPIPIDDAVLDYQILNHTKKENGEDTKRILLVVAYRELVDHYVGACRKAGIDLVGIDLEAFALLRAMGAPGETENGAALIVVAVGHDRSTFAVSNGRACEFTRVLEWGGSSLDVALGRALEIEASEAESLKRTIDLETTTPPPGLTESQLETAQDAIRRQIQTFARDLVSSLQFYQNQPGSLAIGEIVITGGTSHLPGLAEELESLMGVTVRVGDPLHRVRVAEQVVADDEQQIGSLAVAIGLGIED